METTKLLNSEFLDILFDDRNKDYGAYDLRRKYDKRVRNAVMGMSAIVLIIIGGYTISTRLIASDKINDSNMITEIPDMIDPITDVVEPPAYTPPPVKQVEPPVSQPTVDAAVFKVAPDEEVTPDDEVPKNADLEGKIIGLADRDGDPNGVTFESDGFGKETTGVVEAPKVVEKEKTYTFVEIMPEFPGGEKALVRFLNDNVIYPARASENEIQGIVSVKFVVNKKGEIENVIVESAKKGGGLEEEAIRVVRKMPKWRPGKQNGEAVAVYFNLPINFKLAAQ